MHYIHHTRMYYARLQYLYVHWTCESRFHTTHWKVAECSSHSYKCPKSIKLQNNSRSKHHIERHNQYATDICPHLVVTSQLQEKIDSTGHQFNTTDPLKFDSIGKQKVNSIRIIENARTSATEVQMRFCKMSNLWTHFEQIIGKMVF
jgi:hypothetical protein